MIDYYLLDQLGGFTEVLIAVSLGVLVLVELLHPLAERLEHDKMCVADFGLLVLLLLPGRPEQFALEL